MPAYHHPGPATGSEHFTVHLAPAAPIHVSRETSQNIITVQAGDTLSAIAGKDCNNPDDWTGIAARNKIPDPNVIYPGQKFTLSCVTATIKMPVAPPPPVTHYSAAVTGGLDHDGDHDNDWSDAPVTNGSSGHIGAAAVSAPANTYVSVGAGVLSFTQIEQLWVSAGGPAWAEYAAGKIGECESGGRTNAYNPSGATGVFQILGAVIPGNLNDPFINAENAVAKFKASGGTWAQWVCQP